MVSALQHVSDFANLFKAFIGSNYLSMPFAFSQSGLALGISLLLFIAVLTDHCCYLIVTCKQLMVESLVNDNHDYANNDTGSASSSSRSYYNNDGFYEDAIGSNSSLSNDDGDQSGEIRQDQLLAQSNALHQVVTLGDIAKFTFGKPGLWLVNVSLFITQFGFCINYFIFIGNTLKQVLSIGVNSTAATTDNFTNYMAYDSNLQQLDEIELSATSNTWQPPPLWLLVATPLPLFLGFALIRNIRSMGSVSVIANLSICAGVVAVMAVMLHEFTLSDSVVQSKGMSLPVYIGMVAVSYEGIGTVIPIESSMEDNRHNFRGFLRGALLVVTGILGGVGAVGYLRYGQDTQQIVVQNLPTESIFVVVLDATLILGVIFTFPLQVYPVIQMTEKLLLARYGHPAFVVGSTSSDSYNADSVAPEERESLISSASVQIDQSEDQTALADARALLASSTPDAAPTWLRNCIRFGIVLCQLGMAILLRNLYAYVSSFIGAVGSIFLAFVLPCAAHLRLIWRRPPCFRQRLILIKNFSICSLGCLASVTSLFVTLAKIFSPHFFD